jgi:hypothetical protein
MTDNFDPFSNFHPLTGEVPTHSIFDFSDIAQQARWLLKKLNTAQILAIAKYIDKQIDRHIESLRSYEIYELKHEHGVLVSDDGTLLLFDDIGWIESNISSRENMSDVETFIECKYCWNGYAHEQFPDVAPYEFFAVLSLWMLADAIDFLKHNLLGLVWERASEALKALNFVDVILEVKRVETTHKLELAKINGENKKEIERLQELVHFQAQEEIQKRKERSIQLNKHRHKKTYLAKIMVIEEWNKDRSKFPSAAKAGNYLANWLLDKGFQYEARTITEWIRDYAKKMALN